MFKGHLALFSILLGLALIGCKDQKTESGAVNNPQFSTAQKEQTDAKSSSDTNIVQSNTNNTGKNVSGRFDPLMANAVFEVTDKEITNAITTWDALGNPSETKFADGSKILYASGGLHQYIDSNGKTTSYQGNEKSLPASSIDSDGFIEQFIYDADGKMISKRNKDGRIIPVRKTEPRR